MNRITWPAAAVTSFSSAFRRSSNSPRNLAPALAQVQRQQAFVFQALRHVAVDDAQGQALDDRGLADTRLADEYRVILGAPRQHLNRAADLLVAADDRVEFSGTGQFGEVAGVFLEGFVLVLGAGAVGAAALAQVTDGSVEARGRDAGVLEDPPGGARLGDSQRQQHVFRGDEGVPGLLRALERLVEQAVKVRREIHLRRRSLDLGQLLELGVRECQRAHRIAVGLLDELRRHAFLIVEQSLEQMFRGDLLMVVPQRYGLRRLEEAAGPIGEFLKIHRTSSWLTRLCSSCGRIWVSYPSPARPGTKKPKAAKVFPCRLRTNDPDQREEILLPGVGHRPVAPATAPARGTLALAAFRRTLARQRHARRRTDAQNPRRQSDVLTVGRRIGR